jgi:hypothetical protein
MAVVHNLHVIARMQEPVVDKRLNIDFHSPLSVSFVNPFYWIGALAWCHGREYHSTLPKTAQASLALPEHKSLHLDKITNQNASL